MPVGERDVAGEHEGDGREHDEGDGEVYAEGEDQRPQGPDGGHGPHGRDDHERRRDEYGEQDHEAPGVVCRSGCAVGSSGRKDASAGLLGGRHASVRRGRRVRRCSAHARYVGSGRADGARLCPVLRSEHTPNSVRVGRAGGNGLYSASACERSGDASKNQRCAR